MHKDESVIPRNNTSFNTTVHERLKLIDPNEQTHLRYFQSLVLEFFKIKTDSRGLLIYHFMGLGKTVLATAIAEYMKSQGYSLVVMLPKSLQSNFKNTVTNKYKKINPNSKLKEEDFKFIVSNSANIVKNLKKISRDDSDDFLFDTIIDDKIESIVALGSLDNKLLIVDEAHNLFRRVANGSKIALQFYEIAMNARNLKIIFLSGTPISSSPFELSVCFNLLNPNTKFPLLPESINYFEKYFVDTRNLRMKNKNKFQNRISGLVSYATHTEESKKNFPEELETIIEHIPFTAQQYSRYFIVREKEIRETEKMAKFKKNPSNDRFGARQSASSSYRVRSRQLCNFVPPISWNYNTNQEEQIKKLTKSELDSVKMLRLIKNIKSHKNQLGLIYSQFIGVGGLKILARHLEVHANYTKYTLKKGGNNQSNTTNNDQSQNLDSIESKYNESDQTNDSNDVNDSNKLDTNKKYVMITGELLQEDIEEIVKIFSSKENVNGKLIHLMLVSSTGVEGLDLKNIRHIHQIEPFWLFSRFEQFKFRAIRYLSHDDLPESERTVQPYIYLTIANPDAIKPMKTTDEELYINSLKTHAMHEEFLDALKEISIECDLTHYIEKCRRCKPNDVRLFIPDIDKDMQTSDPCEPLEETELEAKQIIIDDEEYFYMKNDDSIHGFDLFEFNKDLGGYTLVNYQMPLYDVLIEKIKNN